MSLIVELKRRNVFKVGTAYLALGWVITQVTATVVPYMRLPEWTVPMVLWIGAIGFPCVLIFTWLYELTPEGIKREAEVDRSQSITGETSRKLDYLIVALLAVAITLFVVGPPRGAQDATGATAVGTGLARDPAVVPATDADRAQGALPQGALAQSGLPQAGTGSAGVAQAGDKSIAVLPFTDMSSAKDQEYMSDGIAEELLNLLAKIPELRVIARTSSFAYKGKDMKLADVARELNVAHVLEGSVRTSGNRVRITAQLIRASDSTHLWSETYDRTLDDIFAVQDEIAEAVVGQLKITLLGATPKARQVDPVLYALYLQARQARLSGQMDSLPKAREQLQQVLEKDPAYAEAWVELAGVYSNQAAGGSIPIEEGYRLAKESAERALSIDPGLATGHATLGHVAWEHSGNAVEAALHLERALELAPANTDVLGTAANLLLGLGRLETAVALATYRRDRDPVNPRTHTALAYISLYSGHLDEAIAERRTALALNPDGVGGANRYNLGVAYMLKGEVQAALAEFEQESVPVWRDLGIALGSFATGDLPRSDEMLQKLIVSGAESWSYQIAFAYAYRNEADKAFEWLEKAVQYRDPGLSDVAVDPLFANIHGDPRWLPFLRRIGRAPEQLAAIKFDVKLP